MFSKSGKKVWASILVVSSLCILTLSGLYAQVFFTTRRDFAAPGANGPVAVTVADFNGDRIPDLAVVNAFSKDISIFYGTASGGFNFVRNFPVGGFHPFHVIARDFDNDRILDLATSNMFVSNVQVLLGTSGGGFRPPANFPVSSGNATLAVGDFNNDGILDIASADIGDFDPDHPERANNKISILLGVGNGTFRSATPPTVQVGRAPEGIDVGNFNEDRNLDLVVANLFSNSITVLLGDGRGGFRATEYRISSDPAPSELTSTVVVGDFNNDRKLDVAALNEGTSTVSVFLGDGRGGFSPPRRYSALLPESTPRRMVAEDFNKDGNLDLAIAGGEAESVVILLGDGRGGFDSNPDRIFSAGPLTAHLATGDFNGDGNPDIVAACKWYILPPSDGLVGNVSVLYGDGTGNFGIFYKSGSNPISATVGDVNGDNKLDVAAANAGSDDVWVLLGDGLGGFSYGAKPAVGSRPVSVIMGQFNQDVDNRVDLATANFDSNDVSVLLQNAQGRFDPTERFAVGINPNAIVAGDFNGDGKMDLATANLGSNTVSVLLGDGRGGYSSARTYAVGSGPWHLNVGDFNRDQKLDLVVANSGSNNISVLLNDGQWATPSGGFAAARNFAVGTAPWNVSVAVFNGDEKLDVAVANSGSDNVSILLNDDQWTTPNRGFAPAQNFDAGGIPSSISVSDFDGDRKLDLAVTNLNSDRVSILLGDGRGGFTANFPNDFFVGVGAISVGVGDFNGDRKPDLVFSNFGSHNISVLLNGVP
jgi:hypothetical protein